MYEWGKSEKKDEDVVIIWLTLFSDYTKFSYIGTYVVATRTKKIKLRKSGVGITRKRRKEKKKGELFQLAE